MWAPTSASTSRRRSPTRSCSTAATCVVSGSIVSPRLAACPIEPRATIAQFGDDGRLTMWLSTQTPHQDKMVLGLAARSRARPGPRGGARRRRRVRRQGPATSRTCSSAGSRGRPGVPSRWTETRSENLVAMHHGRAQRDRLRDRRRPRRQGQGAAREDPPGRRRLPGHRRVPGQPDRDDGQRRLRDPEDRGSR